MRGTQELKAASLKETGQYLLDSIEDEDLRISELTDAILKKAVFSRVSDIHIEATRKGSRVRFRIDGVFQDLAYLPLELHDQIVARIKVMADLLTHRREIVQEGRISLDIEGTSTDLRVSIVPSVGGEKVVVRIFSMAEAVFDLGKVGYTPEMMRSIRTISFDLEGLFLLTGPSGSGKTTTLYSLLNEIAREMDAYASIITIEDPVEYEFGLWSQMQVNRQVDLDFAAGLRAALRQDPEVIMVGEIRDVETAEVALRAGLTGHMVLSTLHSGSAPETVTRLVNMDLEPFVVASSLTGTIAQRLVRRLCPECQIETGIDANKLDLVRRLTGRGEEDEVRFFEGKGCEACHFTGYLGRLPIAEFLVIDEELRGLILEKARTSQIRRFLLDRGWNTILDDGLEKALAGLTTFEEIMRNVSLREAR